MPAIILTYGGLRRYLRVSKATLWRAIQAGHISPIPTSAPRAPHFDLAAVCRRLEEA